MIRVAYALSAIAASLLMTAAISIPAIAASAGPPQDTPERQAERIDWWRQARFGMFIDWGLYSVPGRGEWGPASQIAPLKR